MASTKLVILLLPLAIRLTKVKSLAKRVVVLAKEIALHQLTDIILIVLIARFTNVISPVKLALIAQAVFPALLVLVKIKT